MRFKDKVAVITGGTSGMGEAAVLGFVREGASVVVNDINKDGLEKISEKIQSMGGDVLTVHGDITKKETISRMVNDAIAKYDKIDMADSLPGDIVVYFAGDGNVEHSGIVVRGPSQDTFNLPIVVSKWGEGSEVIHLLTRCDYSMADIRFYRVNS